MTQALTLDLDLLRQALNRCLDECEQRLGRHVDLGADHYWVIDPRAAFDLAREPQVSAGQLSDDLDEMTQLLVKNNEDFLTIWHEIEHVLGPLARLAALTKP